MSTFCYFIDTIFFKKQNSNQYMREYLVDMNHNSVQYISWKALQAT